jgi:hypothetical protein
VLAVDGGNGGDTAYSASLEVELEPTGALEPAPPAQESEQVEEQSSAEHQLAVRRTARHMRVVVEASHGSRPQEDGALRVDCSLGRPQLLALLATHATVCAERAQAAEAVEAETALLREAVAAAFRLRGVAAGTGVDAAKFLACLRQLHAYSLDR